MTDLIVTYAPDALLIVRAFCHAAVCLIVAAYTSDTIGHRRIIGYCSGIFAGANAAEAGRIWLNFHEFSGLVQPWLTMIMIGVLYFVLVSGGNMARFLPRRIVERLP